MRKNILIRTIGLILASIVLLSYNDDPPNGRTGAPFNGHCGDCNTIKFYYIVNFCNGGGDFGDFPIAFSDSIYFAGGLPLSATAITLQHNDCQEDMNGIAHVQASGGKAPYLYQWSNGMMEDTIESLANGVYSVTVQDQSGCLVTDSKKH